MTSLLPIDPPQRRSCLVGLLAGVTLTATTYQLFRSSWFRSLLRRLNSSRRGRVDSTDLSDTRLEVEDLLALLRAHDEEDRTHIDLHAITSQVQTLQQRVVELEGLLEEKKAAEQMNAADEASSSSSLWPHTYPLSTPATHLPQSLIAHAHNRTGVLFDLDGTLVESKEIWYMLLNACSFDLGYGVLDRERWEPTYGQSMEKNRELFFPSHQQQVINDFCNEHYKDFVSHLKILPGTIAALTATRDFLGGSDRMVICTNCPQPITELIVSSVPALAQFFTPDRIICAGKPVKVTKKNDRLPRFDFSQHQLEQLNDGQTIEYQLQPKPSTDIIIAGCEVIGTTSKEVIFIGDSKFDLIASMAAHSFAIGLDSKGHGGNMFLDSIGDLPRVFKTTTETGRQGTDGLNC